MGTSSEAILIGLITFTIILFLISLGLWMTVILAKKYFKQKIRRLGFMTAFKVGIIYSIVITLYTGIFLLISSYFESAPIALVLFSIHILITIGLFVFYMWLIKKCYSLEWLPSILISFGQGILSSAVIAILAAAVGVITYIFSLFQQY